MLVNNDGLYAEALQHINKFDSWVVDVETNGLDPYGYNQICGIGIAVNDSNLSTYYFPFRHQQPGNLDLKYLPKLMEVMNSRTELIGHNIKFDLKFLAKDGLDVSNKTLIDTMLLIRLTADTTIRELGLTKTIKRFYGDEAASYDIETKKYLRSNKWQKDFSLAPPDVLGGYCEKDVYWTLRLYNDCLVKIKQSGQLEILELEYALTKVLYDMESRGVVIDTEYVETAISKLERRKEQLEEEIYKLSDLEFNIRSTQEISGVFHKLGIHSNLFTATGKESWGVASLAQINHPLAGLIRQHRALSKLASTYLEPYLSKEILHTSFCNWGTLTGRLSSREPNLQNIPRNHFKLRDVELSEDELNDIQTRLTATISATGQEVGSGLDADVLSTWGFMGDASYDDSDPSQISIRRLFRARPGYNLISFDYSQMEVRVFLSYLRNTAMMELLNRNDVDFHGEAAKIAFDITEDHADFKEYRQLAKGITFGIIYGIGSERLAQQLRTTKREASQYKKRYLDGIEGSREFIRGVMKAVEERGWIKNRYGRVYKVPSTMSYKGVNYLVQGTSADILNERLIEVSKLLQNTKSKMLLQVHDEIILEMHDDEIYELVPQIVDIMQTNSLDIPLFVDKEVCPDSWANKVDYEKWVTSPKQDGTLKHITLKEAKMAKISLEVSVTKQLVSKTGQQGYFKAAAKIDEIDLDKPLDAQYKNISECFEATSEHIKDQILSQLAALEDGEYRAPVKELKADAE